MTTHTTTVPQLLLPGQAAAHSGPVDLTLTYVVHHGLRRDLAAFAAAVPATPVGSRRTWQALARRWGLFSWVLHHHHSGEDAVAWPLLRERATADELAVLAAMEAEHADLGPLVASCTAGFERLARHPDADGQRALAIRLVAARERLGAHLAHEETAALAVVQRVLDQADWDEVDRASRSHVTLRRLLQVVPWALWQLPAEAYDCLATQPGAGAHRVVAAATRPGFARRERAAFAALAPT